MDVSDDDIAPSLPISVDGVHLGRDAHRADDVGSSASTDWGCEMQFDFDSVDCNSNVLHDSAPLSAGHLKPHYGFDSLVLQAALSFLVRNFDYISVEHFLEMRILIRKNIPK